MSGYADEAYAVYRERVRKARKPHKCSACRSEIRAGDRYMLVTWVLDRSAGGVKRCGACQKTHEHLRKLCWEQDADMWPDESLDCGIAYNEEWGDVPDEVAALPFLSADERSALLAGVSP